MLSPIFKNITKKLEAIITTTGTNPHGSTYTYPDANKLTKTALALIIRNTTGDHVTITSLLCKKYYKDVSAVTELLHDTSVDTGMIRSITNIEMRCTIQRNALTAFSISLGNKSF